MQIIGARIKQAREAAGMTQQQLADELGVLAYGTQRVSQWESGRRVPKADALMRIARITGVTIEWLMNGDPQAIQK